MAKDRNGGKLVMVMPRVLLITFCYPPTEVIGSVRPGALAKYLPRFGWEPMVLTPRVRQPRSDSRMIETDYRDVISSWKTRLGLDHKRNMHEQFGLPLSSKPGAGFLHSRAFNLGKYFVSYPDPTKGWIPFALQAIKDIRDQGQKIDAILTTSPPISVHLIGNKAKTILGCPWVADLRDLWTENFANPNPLLNRLQTGLEKRTLREADALVTVSNPWAARLQEKYPSQTVSAITNGFDPNDFAEIPKKLTGKFTITYAGRLYQGGRNPKVLFEVLRDLVDENIVSPRDVQVRFYGQVEPWLTALVQQYRLEELVGIFGLVTRHESLQRQAESQVLLLLGWSDPRETGQHSGKLFEYFGAARPILAIGGSRGVLTEALEETHAGVHALSKEQVRNFLVTAYSEFKTKGCIPYLGEETAINRYTHLRMARQFADLLNSVSHKSQPSELARGSIAVIACDKKPMLSTEPELKNERSDHENASPRRPLVSVLVVVRNGCADILGVVDSIRQQDYRPLELLIVDGMSDDGTRELVQQQISQEPNFSIRLLDNAGRIQASGWNVGIRAAGGEYVLRIDAVHCRLQPNYIRCCLEKLLELRQTDPSVAATGGRRLSVARTENRWSEAIASAQSCRFGVGGAGYRLDTQAGFKDTLGVPLYDRSILFQVGLFDESLGRSEDNYLHAQLRWQGFNLYFIPDVSAIYHPRETLSGLASQMFHNGWWVSATIHRKRTFPFGTRHLIPFAFYGALIFLAGLSVAGFFPAKMVLGALVGIYLAASLVAAFLASPAVSFWRIAVIFWLMHFCYAAGTAAGCFAGKSGGAATGTITAPGAHQG